MKSFKVFLSWFVVFLVLTTGFFFILRTFRDPLPPIRYASIPEETVEFFRRLIDTDFRFRVNPNPDPDDWGRYDDAQMDSVSDANFIVFYQAGNEKWKKRATEILGFGAESVKELDVLMGGYPYPEKINNRKIPVYLAANGQQFRKLGYRLGGGDPGTATVGVFYFEFSYYGCMPRGILLSPRIYTENPKLEPGMSFQENVFKHELNHFAYFYHFDFMKLRQPYLWFTEGIAEYYANSIYRLDEVNSLYARNFNLNSTKNSTYEYWIGFTAFKSYEKEFSPTGISKMIVNSYALPIDKASNMATGLSLKQWDLIWKKSLNLIQ